MEDLPIRMTADDFAFYAREIPGCMFRLGVKPSGLSEPSDLHTATLTIDEEALSTGAQVMAALGASA